MNRTLIIAIVLLVLVGGVVMLNTIIEKRADSANLATYESEEFGLSFKYPSQYLLIERETGNAERRAYSITLIENTPGNRDLLSGRVVGEGPPAITIQLFQNDLDSYTAEEWIRGVNESNFKLSPEQTLSKATISGKEALSYRWSGLYEATTIVQPRPKWLYAFTVTYLEMGAPIVQDFVTVRDSVKISE